MMFTVWKADPKFEVEGCGDVFAPVLTEGLAGESAHGFVDERAEAARVVGVTTAKRPCGNLIFDRGNHRIVVMHIGILIENREAALVGKKVGEICFGNRKIFPYLAHGRGLVHAVMGEGEQ